MAGADEVVTSCTLKSLLAQMVGSWKDEELQICRYDPQGAAAKLCEMAVASCCILTSLSILYN